MSGGGTPKDNSVELENIKYQHQQEQQRIADEKAAKETARLGGLRDTAKSNAINAANSYFTSQGLDPRKYASTINDIISSIAGGISTTDTNPGSAYKDVNTRAFDTAQTGERGKASRSLDAIFQPNFEYTRLPDTYDDATLGAINAEQRQTAEQFLNNLKARGVVTDSGYAAAEKNLDTQSAGVLSRLNEIGGKQLETGRQTLRDVGGRARTAADTLRLGQQFNASQYGSELDKAFMNFVNNLGTSIRGSVGTANLYDTAGLPAIAGAAQGAGGSQVYDPKALAGIYQDEKDTSTANRTATGGTGVF